MKIQYKIREEANIGVFMSIYLESAIVQHKEIMAHSISMLRHLFKNILGKAAILTPFLLLPTTCAHLLTDPLFIMLSFL